MKTILLLLLTAVSAFARLGDTIEQSEMRYGKPVLVTKKVSDRCLGELFLKDGVYILEKFLDGRCVWVEFTHRDTGEEIIHPQKKIRDPFTWEELAAIRDQNGSHWNEGRTDSDNSHFYFEAAGGISAMWIPDEDSLSISGPADATYENLSKVADEAAAKSQAEKTTRNL